MTPEPSALDQVLCMTPRCHKKAYERGVCLSCLHTADLLVEQGVVTRERLEQLGLLLPYEATSGFFMSAFNAAIDRRANGGEEVGER